MIELDGSKGYTLEIYSRMVRDHLLGNQSFIVHDPIFPFPQESKVEVKFKFFGCGAAVVGVVVSRHLRQQPLTKSMDRSKESSDFCC